MRETCEKKGRTWDNSKIDYTCFVIQLFSRTIKFYPSSHEKISLSCAQLPLPPRDDSRRESWETCLMKQHKQHEITHTHMSHFTHFSHLTNFSQIVCSRLEKCEFENFSFNNFFKKKKQTIFSKITSKNNFMGHDLFWGKRGVGQQQWI